MKKGLLYLVIPVVVVFVVVFRNYFPREILGILGVGMMVLGMIELAYALKKR